jgi:hypothetical protein
MPGDENIKEVFLETSAPVTMEGGSVTRRRARRGRRSTARQNTQTHEDQQEGGFVPSADVLVEKHEVPVPAPAPMPVGKELAPVSLVGGAKKTSVKVPPSPVVVLAPAKKKTKIMLVPKGKAPKIARKTFKAKRVHVTIDNTEKTRKRQRQVLGRVDAMTDDQVRAAAISAKLSRRESVAAVPATLLRQMLKDYQTMKGNLL